MSTDSLDTAIKRLHHARHPVVLTGAGVSTRSGIPDFRSPRSGLWAQHDPAEVASIYGFRQNPKRFYDWLRPLVHTILEAQPNPAHLALAHLEHTGRLKCVITQNIDMLHTRAGSQIVYELHGHLREATCIYCFAVYPARPFIDAFLESGEIPVCPVCGHVLKPNAILYGEQLPTQVLRSAQQEARLCDVMLVAGSSLEVYPAAELPLIAWHGGASLIFVNLGDTPLDSLAEVVIRQDVADVLPRIVSALENGSNP